MNQETNIIKIGIVSGSSLKAKEAMRAEELFSVSPLTRYSLAYCKAHYDETLILVLDENRSVLTPSTVLEPFDLNLYHLQRAKYRDWCSETAEKIKQVLPKTAKLYFHAGKRFRGVIPYLEKEYECNIPLKSVPIGKQLNFYIKELGQIENPFKKHL